MCHHPHGQNRAVVASWQRPPIGGGISAQDEQPALALDLAGDFNWLGDEFDYFFVHRFAFAGNKQEIDRGAVRLADEEHGGMPPLMQRIAQARCGMSAPGFITPR